MNTQQARDAQLDGAYVQFSDDGAEFVGTVHDLDNDKAEIDIAGYRNHPQDEWRLRTMQARWVPVEWLQLHGRKTADHYSATVEQDSDQVVRLFSTGDQIETTEGPGELIAVQFNAAKYLEGWELEPPSLVVELDSGETIHTCLCTIELPGTVKGTKLIHQEFDRLWPAKTDGVPPDADMLIPEGSEEPNMREARRYHESDHQAARRYAEEQGYQGWKNYETWAVALWLSNDEGTYRYWQEEIEMLREEFGAVPEHEGNRSELQITLGKRLGDEIKDGNPLADQPSMYSDLLGAAVDAVDFYEIADSMLEE